MSATPMNLCGSQLEVSEPTDHFCSDGTTAVLTVDQPTHLRRMLNNVLSLDESSGVLSDTYAPGMETVGASPEAVEVAIDGAGERLSLFGVEACDEGFMTREMAIR